MMNKLLVLSGDGIGPEVMAQVMRVVDWLARKGRIQFDVKEGLIGGCSCDAHGGVPLTDETLADAMAVDAVLLGAVGQLQFDVLAYRLENEYRAEPILEAAPFASVRWLAAGTTLEQAEGLRLGSGVRLARDVQGQLVVLFPDPWWVGHFMKENPNVELHLVSPHVLQAPGSRSRR